LAVDEIIVRFEGRSKETTTVPNKPIPTGYKVWGTAQRGFLLIWNWHIPGQKNRPVGVYTPRELGRTIKAGNGGNKTQAVVLYLIKRLPKLPKGSGYYIYLDNLFVSTRFVQYARSQGVAITGTCRTTSRVIKELLDLQKSDKKDIIPWGETHSRYTPNGEVYYIGWKDQAFVLIISSFISGNKRILQLRKRPKETSSKAKTIRKPFGNQATKVFSIPVITDGYNYYMGAVDEFDYLTAQNTGLRYVERGGHQALEHWLLRTVLINCYLLALYSNIPEPRQVSFRSQQDFRRQLISTLIAKGRDSKICPKQRILQISQEAKVPIQSHKQVKLSKAGKYICYKSMRYRDRPKKRVVLAQITANQGRESSRHQSIYGCEQCNVHLYKNRGCFDVFHREK
jgi:hypothetical protein